MDYRGGDH